MWPDRTSGLIFMFASLYFLMRLHLSPRLLKLLMINPVGQARPLLRNGIINLCFTIFGIKFLLTIYLKRAILLCHISSLAINAKKRLLLAFCKLGFFFFSRAH